MNILFIGDIFGKIGRSIITGFLPDLKREFSIDICLANGENVAHGRGITEKTAKPLFDAGIDIFTSGNHLWDKKETITYLTKEKKILKPINYNQKAAGNTSYTFRLDDGRKLAVFCLVGQAFMSPANSPIEAVDKILPGLKEETDHILVDLHGEATAEKRALAFYLDGKVSALLGTHTHIQTADEEILPQGMAYITDVGMTGPHDSVIGIKKDIIIQKMITGMPVQYEISESGLQINAVFLELDDNTGKAVRIERIRRKI